MKIERKRVGAVTILAFDGEFDAVELPKVEEQTDTQIQKGCTRLVFNLRLVRFIDSTALGFLIKTAKRLSALGGEMVVSMPSKHVQTTIKLLGIDEILRVFPSDEAAVKYFHEAREEEVNAGD
jgi:anti-sigma B factor antagonist